MKFDGEKAKSYAARFPVTRLPWTADGRRAARVAAQAFTEAGYQVDLTTSAGSPSSRNTRITLAWIGFGVFVTTAAGWLQRPSGILVLFVGLTWLRIAPRAYDVYVRVRGSTLRARNVVARRPGVPETPVRVAFVTTIDASPPFPAGKARRRAGQLLGLTSLILVCNKLFGGSTGRNATLIMITAFDLALVAWLIARVRPFVGEGNGDDRDGLGTLLELASTWPKSTDRRIESVFVAAGGQHLDASGLRALPPLFREGSPKKPTLVIGLWRPGTANGMSILANTPDLELLSGTAAAELWLDWPVVHSRFLLGDHWPTEDVDIGFVGLTGNGRMRNDVEPRILASAAQLATEIALRWARTKTAQVAGESREMSSQKPG